MGWKIIEIESNSTLKLFLNNLIIYRKDEKIIIPINDIDVLLINNYMINMSIQLINELSVNNTLTIICNNQYLPTSLILPIIGNYNTLKIIEQQILWTKEYKSLRWQEIIRIKIKNQIKIVSLHNPEEEILNGLKINYNDVKPWDITNREGHSAKIYWHAVFGIKFKRFNEDIINASLNYGYTILRGYFCRSIIKKGLDPRISIFHKSFTNYFALASDLMEPFRFLIDHKVIELYGQSELKFSDFKTEIIGIFNQKVLINNSKQYINNAIDIFIDKFISGEKLPEIELQNE